jgi:hypothetical protein
MGSWSLQDLAAHGCATLIDSTNGAALSPTFRGGIKQEFANIVSFGSCVGLGIMRDEILL